MRPGCQVCSGAIPVSREAHARKLSHGERGALYCGKPCQKLAQNIRQRLKRKAGVKASAPAVSASVARPGSAVAAALADLAEIAGK